MHAKDTPAPSSEGRAATGGPGLSWVHEAGEALLWTRFLRVPALAARPQRVMLSLFLVVLVGFLGGLRLPWRDAESPAFLDAVLGAGLEAFGQVWRGAAGLDVQAASEGYANLIAVVPTLALTEYPIELVVLGVPILLVFAVLAGAVCRSVACEYALEITLPWTQQLGFAVSRWRSMVGVLALPIGVLGVIALVLAVGGFVFFNVVPGLELVGGLVFGVGLMLGLGAVVLLVLLSLAWPMLLPAAACEGTDAIDAAGRALAYAIARPARLVMYLIVTGFVCVVAGGIAIAIANGAAAFTEGVAGAWVSFHGAAEITGSFPASAAVDAEGKVLEIGTLATASAWMVGFWGSVLRVVAASYVVSMVLTAGTLLYLFMRQVCDGQHYAELWTPGQIERSFEAAMRDSEGTPGQNDA